MLNFKTLPPFAFQTKTSASTVLVTSLPTAQTHWAASTAPVFQGTKVTASTAKVRTFFNYIFSKRVVQKFKIHRDLHKFCEI